VSRLTSAEAVAQHEHGALLGRERLHRGDAPPSSVHGDGLCAATTPPRATKRMPSGRGRELPALLRRDASHHARAQLVALAAADLLASEPDIRTVDVIAAK
jgi:hypothetical protein